MGKSPVSVSGQMSERNGYYYHVAVSSDIPGAKSSIEFDLIRDDTVRIEGDTHNIYNKKVFDIINNFKKFEEINCEERTFRPEDVTQILVYMTQGNIESKQDSSIDKRAYTNSEKWNKIVLRHGDPKNEEFGVRIPKPSMSDDYKFSKRQTLVNSLSNVYDFCKVMITLVSGFFASIFRSVKIPRG